MSSFKIIRQLDSVDCGPTCLQMICKYHNYDVSIHKLRTECDKELRGVSLFGIHQAALKLGFSSTPLKLTPELFFRDAQLPCILHWKGNHYIVVYKISKNKVYLGDPGVGKLVLNKMDFIQYWTQEKDLGVALFLHPTTELKHTSEQSKTNNGLIKIISHLVRYKKLLWQLGIGALVVSLLNLAFPFLTQALVDQGIGNQNISFLFAILIAQFVLFASRTLTEFMRGWILIHVGARVNVAVLSEFLIKLMGLPLSYFGKRNIGDILQRINDHKKIEEFLTSYSVGFIFSIFNLIIFSIVMAIYSATIFTIFLIGSSLSVFWVVLFLNKRKVLDYKQFGLMTTNQNKMIQLVNGMAEVKLNQCELDKRWKWEEIQGKLFNVRLNALALEQYQQAGSLFLNEGKNILITFIAAHQVIVGNITLGMMMAITYILGQMNAPIEQMLNFMRLAQDAKISMERLNEIHEIKDEKKLYNHPLTTEIPKGGLKIDAVSFKYSKHDSEYTLKDIEIGIPHRKTTAIVGASGSGKTTLMKLLLKFYTINSGTISLNEQDFNYFCPDAWRSRCGVVMQDGFIFDDSIANNIVLRGENIDFQRMIHAAKTANIYDEIKKLSQGFYTPIGIEGICLSGGQMQRILIARAVYKNPDFLFFDEATSALDASNEKKIQENLQYFFKGKTVVVIAHRLSTVKSADQIIVLDKGKVVESGNHKSLLETKGYYFELVKNQLELGRVR